MLRSALINVMVAAARKASRALLRDFGEVENLQVSLKGPANFVSNADLESERTLRTAMVKAKPGTTALLKVRRGRGTQFAAVPIPPK